VAARKYVDQVCRKLGGVPLFVFHDFDKSGFEICQCLTTVSDAARQNDRVRYEFQNAVQVYDLGLRLEDVEKYGLQTEHCDLKGDFGSDSICTEDEKAFLRSGRRVELNAFTAPDFIQWIEEKLNEHLFGERFIPVAEILKRAYRRAFAVAEINRTIEEARDEAIKKAEKVKLPKTLKRDLMKSLEEEDEPWDVALYRLAEGAIAEKG
jgi:hypothetical protein